MPDAVNGQRVLIIGGSSGIGLATTKAALAAGALITIASNDEKALSAVAHEIGSANLSTKRWTPSTT
jgi:NAD(P)-dependent dehydrogenase (short-subunit alcohol dehydrogenase family)